MIHLIIKEIGIAGTLESSDITISIEQNEGKGIEIQLKSTVEKQFGAQIREVIREKLSELGIKDAIVRATDKGALDCTIQARLTTAVSRATGSHCFPWEAK